VRLQFNPCLRQHGVNVSDQGNGIAGAPRSAVPQSTLQSAMSACQQYQKGAFGNFSAGQQTQLQDDFVKYTHRACACAETGSTCPTRTFSSGGGPSAGGGFQQARQNPNFQQVNAKCEHNLPSQAQGAAGGGNRR
jgi:hypothetical protein